MYLFTRQFRLSGARLRAGTEWAVETTEFCRRTTGLPINLWAEVYSPRPNNLVWAVVVPDLPALETAFDKLMVENHYHDLLDTGLTYGIASSVEDQLRAMVHPQEPRAATEDLEYCAVVTSNMANGHLADGIAVGVEIAQMAEKITGIPTAFFAHTTGNYGGVDWITLYANAAEMDRASTELNTSPEFVELVDTKAGSAFMGTPGATTQRAFRKII